jgi:hypothetical protein
MDNLHLKSISTKVSERQDGKHTLSDGVKMLAPPFFTLCNFEHKLLVCNLIGKHLLKELKILPEDKISC